MKTKHLLWIFSGLLAITLLAIFFPVLGYYNVLNTPDGAPFYYANHIVYMLRRLLVPRGGTLFYPGLLSYFALPPLVYHDLHYVLCTVAVAWATVYYLRGLRLGWIACLCGGFAMAFSGYHFTLVSAGHRGYFDMMPWAILMLAWVDRSLRDPRARYPVSAGIALAFGISTQPDVMALFVMLTALYALVLGIAVFRAHAPAQRPVWAKRLALSLAVALPVLILATAAPLGKVFTTLLPGRKAQIAEASSAMRSGSEESSDTEEPPPEDAWIFATNWSLPPSESLEFIAPFFFGLDTYNSKGPYWGALGRSPRWEEYLQQVESFLASRVPKEQRPQQRENMLGQARNYRQHTTYLGGIPLLFAFLALLWCWRFGKKAKGKRPSGKTPGPMHGAGSEDASVSRSAVCAKAGASLENRSVNGIGNDGVRLEIAARFWTIAAAATLLLAFGRYTPAYRLFYALPMMSHLRAPVKFLHLTELAVAILFAVGVHLCVKGARMHPSEWKRQRGAVAIRAGAGAAVVLLLLAAVPALWRNSALSALQAAGMPSGLFDMLLARSQFALAHGGLALGAGVFLMFLIAKGPAALRGRNAATILLPALALDACLVCAPFIRAVDVGSIYRPNPVIETIQQAASFVPERVSNRIGGTSWFDPLSGALRHHRIPQLEPSNLETPYGELYEAFADQPQRLWAETGTRFILGEAKELAPLIRHPGFASRLGFDLDRQGHVRAVSETGRFLLVERLEAEPVARLYHDWETVAAGKALEAMTGTAADTAGRVWVESPPEKLTPSPDTSPEAATVLQLAGRSLRNRTRIEAHASAPGILLLRRGFSPKARAQANGQNVPVLRVNHAWIGIPISEPGKQEIVIDYGQSYWRLVTALSSFLLLVLLWLPAFQRNPPRSSS